MGGRVDLNDPATLNFKRGFSCQSKLFVEFSNGEPVDVSLIDTFHKDSPRKVTAKNSRKIILVEKENK